MITLGIESTAHTLGIGIIENGKVLSNIHSMYKPIKEGILPRKAAEHHAEVFFDILKTNLEHAKLRMHDIDVIAFAQGPGIGAPLRLGVVMAKYLAKKYCNPLIGVNHAYAHAKISEHLTNLKNPLYLYLSGGNSQLLIEDNPFVSSVISSTKASSEKSSQTFHKLQKIPAGFSRLTEKRKYYNPFVSSVISSTKASSEKSSQTFHKLQKIPAGFSRLTEKRKKKFHVLGETLDMGIGNLFDAFARNIGLEHAHGAAVAELAKNGKYIELPYSVKGMNLVFSGLLTYSSKLARICKKEDVAFSLMETAFAMCCEITERALFLTKKKKLVICGGVAQNKRLQEMLAIMCKEDKVKFGVAPDEFNRDNGAMIAFAGEILYKKYKTKPVEEWEAIQNYRIDDV